ncbi:MAG: type II toxin-antitoxin system VapC family toxin [Euryarchaeota archaeon]|nr:type II toxin-antitoxin system VapC family toxin [Euryarchaeota archaeon]
MKVFIDSNIFINFLTDSEDSDRAYRLMKQLSEGYALYTSITVVEEVFYIITREILRDRGINNKFKLKEYISKRDYEEIRKYLEKFMGMLDKLSCEILGTNGEAAFLLVIMTNYNLLPNDALIAATCKHHGIKKIATFDPDFKRVDFLEIIELEE